MLEILDNLIGELVIDNIYVQTKKSTKKHACIFKKNSSYYLLIR